MPGGRRLGAVASAAVPGVPLTTPLSQLLVAFTIELDNDFESRMAAAAPGRFRVSLVMWSIFLRLVGDGITVRDLGELQTKPVMRTRVEWFPGIALFHPRAAARLWSIADAAVTA